MSLKLLKISIIFLIFQILKIGAESTNNTVDNTILPGEMRVVGGYCPDHHILAKYVVSVKLSREKPHQFGYKHFCAGSIIAANKILTAAHCVFR